MSTKVQIFKVDHQLGTKAQPIKSYAAGRQCAEESCITTISKYNKGSTCWFHTSPKIPRVRGRQYEKGEL